LTEQVDFYVLDNGNRQDKLQYACRITQKAYDQGLKVFVQSDDQDISRQMDSLLWTFSPGSFIPHCIQNTLEVSWQDYPVQLGTLPIDKTRHGEEQHGEERPGEGQSNKLIADVLINLADTPPDTIFSFSRIVDLVSADQTDRLAGRERFRKYREKGHEPNTYKLGQKKWVFRCIGCPDCPGCTKHKGR
jgi:DNA polymerase-3 subunit chi